jgi:hypothetical protein
VGVMFSERGAEFFLAADTGAALRP